MIDKILKEFFEEVKKNLKVLGILEFGSSTYSKNPQDFDFLIFFDEYILSTNTFLSLNKLVKDFERKYEEIVFDYGDESSRLKKAKYSISIVLLGKRELRVENNPHDLFFYKNLAEGKDNKLWYGKNPLQAKKLKISKEHLFEMLSVDIQHFMRKSLDDEERKLQASYFMFKTLLRSMLINEKGVLPKEKLITSFEKEYAGKIVLPPNSRKIIQNKLISSDFEDILKFAEDCLKYLVK